jgi:hypothetical protein
MLLTDTQKIILAEPLMLKEWTEVFLPGDGSFNPPIPSLILSENKRPKPIWIIA